MVAHGRPFQSELKGEFALENNTLVLKSNFTSTRVLHGFSLRVLKHPNDRISDLDRTAIKLSKMLEVAAAKGTQRGA